MPDTHEKPVSAIENLDEDLSETKAESVQVIVETESISVGKKPRGLKAPKTIIDNKVVKLLEKNPLGMTLPEMAGGPRQQKKIKTLRPQLSQAIKDGLVMPISQRAGHTVYRLVKHLSGR